MPLSPAPTRHTTSHVYVTHPTQIRPGPLWTAVLLLTACATAGVGALLAISAMLLLTLTLRGPRAPSAPPATAAAASSVPEATVGSGLSGSDLDSAASDASLEGLLGGAEEGPLLEDEEGPPAEEGPSDMTRKEGGSGPSARAGARAPDPDDGPDDDELGSEEALLQHVAGWQASPGAVQLGELGGLVHSTGAVLTRGESGLRRRDSRHPSAEDVS